MKANELRIGNHVVYMVDSTFRQGIVSVVSRHKCTLITENNENISAKVRTNIIGIPLTKEWLVKLGFEKQEQYIKRGNGVYWQPEYPRTIFDSYKLNVNGHVFAYVFENMQWKDRENVINEQKTTIIIYGSYYDFVDGSDSVYCKEIEYVHQLQNLFFALTGKELIIKE